MTTSASPVCTVANGSLHIDTGGRTASTAERAARSCVLVSELCVATASARGYPSLVATPKHRDDILEQLRAMPLEDRDYIEAALMREAHEQGRRTESPDELAEIVQRATDALANPEREESVARANAVAEAIRSQKP